MKWRWLLACGLIVVAVVIGVSVGRHREPRYNGRSLSEWLGIYLSHSDWRRNEAFVAVQEIGTNALPFLVADLRWKEPEWKRLLSGAARSVAGRSKLNGRLQAFLLSSNRRSGALVAFDILGPTAAPAVPQLVQDFVSPGVSESQAVALGSIGRPAVPMLVAVLTNRANSVGVRTTAMYALRYMGSRHASGSVGALRECVREEPDIAEWAVVTMASVAGTPGEVVPALTGALSSPAAKVRLSAANALGGFGADAEASIPGLAACLTDEDVRVRRGVTNAILHIRAGSK